MNFQNAIAYAEQNLAAFGLKVLGAILLWIVGRWLIGLVGRIITRVLTAKNFDSTLQRYISSIIAVSLNIVLVIGILGYFGIETTSFAALLAAAGIAIGAAWSGLLANFASGAFLIVLRPFKVGDYVVVGGIEGTVKEVGLFASTVVTPDNVVTLVGNNKIFSDTIKNFSSNPYRRVERTAQLDHTVNPADAIARLKTRLAQIPNVIAEPAPDVEILDFNTFGTVLAVRPYCHTDHYWQVFFDTNRIIKDEFGSAGYPVPAQHATHVNAANH